MSRALRIRKVLLFGCLGATLAVSLWTAQRRSVDRDVGALGVVQPAAARMRAVTPAITSSTEETSQEAVATVGARQLVNQGATPIDPFAVRSWQPEPPPPPPPPPAPPAPEPTAPPLPFLYIGRQEQPGGDTPTIVYLTRGPDFLAVVAGDVIGSEYRFDGLVQGGLSFTYIPLSVKQELNIGQIP